VRESAYRTYGFSFRFDGIPIPGFNNTPIKPRHRRTAQKGIKSLVLQGLSPANLHNVVQHVSQAVHHHSMKDAGDNTNRNSESKFFFSFASGLTVTAVF
jgi:hypothetical protein